MEHTKLCQNCVNSIMGEHVKNGKYKNIVYTCKLYKEVLVLDHWSKTKALNCKDFKEENEQSKEIKIIKCNYIVVNNDDELRKAEEYFGGSKSHFLDYPFSIGRERGHLFYSEKTVIPDYFCADNNEKYIYNRIFN